MWLRRNAPISDRVDAGNQLASDQRLQKYAGRGTDTIILALPRGGVPVAFEMAKKLKVPLDLMLVRKLGIPFHEETAMGAIAMGGVTYVNEEFVSSLGISNAEVQRVIRKETEELHRRSKHYRGNKPYPILADKNVIIVDDGIATGATLRAAIQAVKQFNPKQVIAAVPVGARDSCRDLAQVADEMICLHQPEPFNAVGLWYESFPQTEDEEVMELLRKAEQFGKREE
ncbi:hypothetical protein SpCBS45565_g07968 [Spizellomyces sp. 'palustris']|nr:hypothetical protein SpCBS45565_g07968 [Spizellomyces sp. 'palustris']